MGIVLTLEFLKYSGYLANLVVDFSGQKKPEGKPRRLILIPPPTELFFLRYKEYEKKRTRSVYGSLRSKSGGRQVPFNRQPKVNFERTVRN